MENLVDLLPLLFIGLYYLLSSRRRAAAKEAAKRRQEAPQSELISAEAEANAPTPFQSFLEQLEEAMAEAAETTTGVQLDESRETAVPEPAVVPPARIERPPAPSPDFRPVSGSFDGPAAVDHERHGFGPENPLSEEAFERKPTFATTPRRPRPAYDPHGLQPTPRASTPRRSWRARLRDPEAARDAFVLQTIFGDRGGIHGPDRHRSR